MKELLDAMQAKPRQITVATAGLASGGHNTMEAIAKATGEVRHVTYDGGNPAVVATDAGKTEVAAARGRAGGMIRPTRLRPPGGERPATRAGGFGTIEPSTKWVPGMRVPTNYFGIFIPKGVPPDVVATLEKLWAGTSPATCVPELRRAPRRLFGRWPATPRRRRRYRRCRQCAALFAGGKAKVSPDTVGVARP